MTFRRLALASLACAVACGRPAPRAAGPSLITITATDYAFGVPDSLPAGLTTFRLVNQGKELHHANLVRLGEIGVMQLLPLIHETEGGEPITPIWSGWARARPD